MSTEPQTDQQPKLGKPFIEAFLEFSYGTIDDKGFYPQYGMAIDDQDKVEVACIIEPEACHAWLITKIADKSIKEAAFFIDRKRDNSERSVMLTHDDFLTVVYFSRQNGIAVGVVEYDLKTKQIQPIDWNNLVWVDLVKHELASVAKMFRRMGCARPH